MPSINVLIGERDPFMRRALEHILRPHYIPRFVEDGSALLTSVRTAPPALIVTEALLPMLDGFQVCRQLKTDPQTAHIPILLFTWLLARERARQAGADAFLLKPLDAPVFLETIQGLLSAADKEF